MSEVIEKVIATTELGAHPNGLLGPERSDTFIDYMWDATVLTQQARTERMNAVVQEIDTIAIGEHIVRVATEAVDDGMNVRPAFGKISLTLSKLRIDWELSTESLEDGLTGDDLEDRIARMIATQAGNDIEDLLINGDVRSGSALYKAFDGWRRHAYQDCVVLDNGGATVDRGTFNRALRSLNRKFMQQRRNLRFFANSALIQDWMYQQQLISEQYIMPESAAQAALGRTNVAEGPAGFVGGAPFGVTLQEVPLLPEYDYLESGTDDAVGGTGTAADTTVAAGDLWLTFPQNLIVGVKRDIEVHREFKPKKDTVEYTVYTRIGAHVENAEAFVLTENVGYVQ